MENRNKQIVDMHKQGFTLEMISLCFNISRERVHQIIKEYDEKERIGLACHIDTRLYNSLNRFLRFDYGCGNVGSLENAIETFMVLLTKEHKLKKPRHFGTKCLNELIRRTGMSLVITDHYIMDATYDTRP